MVAHRSPTDKQSHLTALGESLRDEQIWDVLAYVKSSWPGPFRVHQRAHTQFAR
jgi:mono/diheme cytochrome c family protein